MNSIKSQVEFLGYIVFGDDIHMDSHKVQTIIDWITLAFVCDVQCFFGFTNFYQHFISKYSMQPFLLI